MKILKETKNPASTLTCCIALFATLIIAGCSPSGYVSREAMTGSLLGTAVGSGVGWLIGNEVGAKTENVVVNAAIGGGVGLLAGALLHEQNISLARKREVVIREAMLVSKNQKELDSLREQVYDSTSWGRNETKPWDERFLSESPNRPYQGPGMNIR